MAKQTLRYGSIPIKQHDYVLYLFSAPAKVLFDILAINEREPDKDEGYQRALSTSRVRSISDFVDRRRTIAPAIVVSLKKGAKFDKDSGELLIPNQPNSGWVIDGQHRLVGAAKASKDITLAVIAFIDMDIDDQVFQFVTINRTAKGVPTSLYYDLLKHLPPSKNSREIAQDKTADIAHELRHDENSPLFNRITVVLHPKSGQTISLTNFVRKVAPLVQTDPVKSPISSFNVQEQTKIIDNYFKGLREHEPELFRYSPSIVFRTVGFGALLNALSTIFSLAITYHQGFRVEDVLAVFNKANFNFSKWENAGSGNAAEIQAGKDLEEEARYAYETGSDTSSTVIKL